MQMNPKESAARIRLFARLCLLCVFVSPWFALVAEAAQDERPRHVDFKVHVEPLDPFSDANAVGGSDKFEVRRGESFLVVIEGKPHEGWHTYPIHKHTEQQSVVQLSKVRLKDGKEFADLWPVEESEPKLVTQPENLGPAYEYEGPFTWVMKVLVRPDASPGTHDLAIDAHLQVCDVKGCTTEDQTLTVPVRVSASPAASLTPEVRKQLDEYDARAKERAEREKRSARVPTPGGEAAAAGSLDLPSYKVIESAAFTNASTSRKAHGGLWATILTAIIGGFISLLTPCVFPMIPVTVSFFLKQSEKAHHRPITMATVYCATLVAVLTVGGVALVHVLQVISQHWITNVFLTGVFVFFALSLFGMYEIELPSGLANLTGAREGKGGLIGIVFMALTFSIISFACVGPIYGAFITLEASSSVSGWLHRILGPLAFSLAFASPFFVLALFPSLLRSMPKSGSWMNSVKVVMGFLELAAAFKFVRAAELNFLSSSKYFTFDLVLGIYVALAVACGLYLLNLYRMPHDHEAPETITVPRLIFGLCFLSFAFYLLPGMFKDDKGKSQQPRGVAYDWVSSFLLPDNRSDWNPDLRVALARAERENKPLFIDFTGLV
jgi:thiol:disulfide interchange protein